MLTSDPLNFISTNVTFDFVNANSGWNLEVLCNYPEATLTGEIVFDNHTIFDSSLRLAPMT